MVKAVKDYIDFYNKRRPQRKLKGMTQQELADASGYSHGYIREIESIKMASTFSLDAVERIANGLGINFKLLFEESKQ